MRTTGTYLAIAGAAIIVLFILFQLLRAIVAIPFWIMIGLVLIIVGAILLFTSLIRERVSDSKKEDFEEVKS